jgi:hypothetical protein
MLRGRKQATFLVEGYFGKLDPDRDLDPHFLIRVKSCIRIRFEVKIQELRILNIEV